MEKIIYFITKGNFGGAQKYVYDLAVNLPKDKFEVVVACGQGDLLIERLKEEKIKTIKIEGLEREISLAKDFKTCRELIKIIKEERPDIVHFNSSKIGFLGALAVLFLKLQAPSFKLKAIFTSHGWAFNEHHRNTLARTVFYISHYLTVLICDTTIAVSEKTKRDIAWLPFIKNKIKVIHNGIVSFKTLTKKDCALILQRENKDQKIILTVGELHPNKGLDLALRGLALLPKAIKEKILYYIVGDGEEKDRLVELAAKLDLTPQVRFLGFVENAKKLLPGADVVLVPSRTENLPFAVLEPGILGLPIIATSVGGIPEIVKDMQSGILVHPRNPKEIAEAIIYLLNHKEKSKEFGIEIKQTVSTFFSLDKMLEETIATY